MKYYIALYQRLKEIYLSQSSHTNDAVLICPSLRLYEMDDLQLLKPQSLLKDTSKTVDAILKKQQVSYELNSLPSSNKYWDLNASNTLFDAYREILNYAKVKDLEQGLKDAVKAENPKLYDVKGKETKEYKAYQKQMNVYDMTLKAVEEHLTLFDALDTEEEKLNWNLQLAILKSKKDQAMADWKVKGFKEMIEEALKVVNSTSETDNFLDLFQSVKNNFDAAEKTDVTTLSAIHDIHFIPYDFMENESGWNHLFLEKSELETLFAEVKSGVQEIPEEIMDIEYDEKFIESIEFDYTFVHLKRGWFNKQIFISEYFQWNEPQTISDGINISTDFKLSAFPKTMLLIKSLKINLNDAVSEKQVDEPDQIIRFGPLILKQQLFTNKTTNQRFLKAVTNKNIIKSDQMNYMIRKANETEFVEVRTEPNSIPTPNILVNRTLERRILVTPKVIASPVNYKDLQRNNVRLGILKFKKGDLFIKIDQSSITTTSKVFFTINDSNSNKGIYKCALSIKGTDNSRVIELETNENGQISTNIPVGKYDLEGRIDGYGILKINFNVENSNPLTFTYTMNREEIKFQSFFLVGMVCERIPKTPK